MTKTETPRVNRRTLLKNAALLGAGSVCAPAPASFARSEPTMPPPELLTPAPLPEQAPAKESYVDVPGARLWYWDTGGEGAAIVFGHPGTGSGAVWSYQQPVFARAGYRVIGYSRKGAYKSSVAAPDQTQPDSSDLNDLVRALGIERFHLVGSAAGGIVALQYAIAHSERLLSMTVACSLGGVQDAEYAALSASLRPAGFSSMPPEFRELGPCYRAANPRGVARWLELEKISRADPQPAAASARAKNVAVTWAALGKLQIPTLLLTGDSDLYTPPPMLKLFHQHIPGSEMVIVHGAGHSAYWEQPEIFNKTVLEFIERRGNQA